MKTLLILAVSTVCGLGYLVHNPTPVAKRLHAVVNGRQSFAPEEWLEKAKAGVEAGNPFWESAYGLALLRPSADLSGLVTPDPREGRRLLEKSAAKGLSSSLFLMWMFSGSSDDALLARAVDLGDPVAINVWLTRAFRTADCSPEGYAILGRELPDAQVLSDNADRVVDLFEAYQDLPYINDARAAFERSYEEAQAALTQVEAGIECTPGLN